ncbi:hypothetical protein BCAR13_810020 [Paraburkholderia caribensis]|nr:hypothetical protein BCAR13_810020 [Paraburkholderia caribensis]
MSTHCRLAASRKQNSTGRFPAMNLKSGLTQPDPDLPLELVAHQWRVAESFGHWLFEA